MMRSVIEQPLVQDYLDQLDAALAALPAGQRVELRAQIVAHLEDALTSTPPEPVADVLTRLGSPEELVAAAVPVAPGEPVHRPRRGVVAALVVLALLLAGGVGYSAARGHGRPAVVSVPQLLGLTSGDARQALDRAGLDMTIRRAGSQQPSGVIIRQLPPAGRLMARG